MNCYYMQIVIHAYFKTTCPFTKNPADKNTLVQNPKEEE